MKEIKIRLQDGTDLTLAKENVTYAHYITLKFIEPYGITKEGFKKQNSVTVNIPIEDINKVCIAIQSFERTYGAK